MWFHGADMKKLARSHYPWWLNEPVENTVPALYEVMPAMFVDSNEFLDFTSFQSIKPHNVHYIGGITLSHALRNKVLIYIKTQLFLIYRFLGNFECGPNPNENCDSESAILRADGPGRELQCLQSIRTCLQAIQTKPSPIRIRHRLRPWHIGAIVPRRVSKPISGIL